jgi:hypothetical protein
MQNTGLALITILIPFAIAIMVDILQKKNAGSSDFSKLDLHVILDRIFRVRSLIFYVGLIFVPPLFWDLCIVQGRVLVFLSWLIGVLFLLKIFFDLYNWTKGNIIEFRLSYLSHLENIDDMVVVWRSIWEVQKVSTDDEDKYFEIFVLKIENLLFSEKNFIQAGRFLNDFSLFLGNRSNEFLLRHAFRKFLEWHFYVWATERDIVNRI